MKRNKALWMALLLVMALVSTGCLGSSVDDKEDDVNVQAELNLLTDEFVEGYTSENPNNPEFLALFTDEMKFVVDFGEEAQIELDDMDVDFEGLIEPEFLDNYLDRLPETIREQIYDLVDLLEDDGDNEAEVNRLLEALSRFFVKTMMITSFVQGDFEEPSDEILMWADQSVLSSDALEMPREVFELYLTFDPWPFEGVTVESKTPPEESEGKWYVVIEFAPEELETEEPATIVVTLGFSKSGTKWLIDTYRHGMNISVLDDM